MSSKNHRFSRIAIAGVTFQAGSAAVDSATIMSALVFQLTGSAFLVGAVPAILRFGWLSPQLFVGFLAQRGASSMGFYKIGAFGRTACIAALALVLLLGGQSWPPALFIAAIMGLWTAYAFVSGIVAVPYNDIVARAVPSARRSRLLALRFFGGGILALGVAVIADRFVGQFAFPASYAAIFAMAALLMLASSFSFVAAGEPDGQNKTPEKPGFFQYLKDGVAVFRTDRRFRMFAIAQWCGGAVLMAMPFYVVLASTSGFDLARVSLLLGSQTTGALLSNPLWGWWGDRFGKVSLLRGVVFGRIFPPVAGLAVLLANPGGGTAALVTFSAMFFVLGALANGITIGTIGFLMEISPDDQRPAYSGYFNALTAPAFLLPLLGGVVAVVIGLYAVFALSLAAAVAQTIIIAKLRP